MIMTSILLMTLIVFFSRYLFLEPRVPLKLNSNARRFLNYSGPTVLTAIFAPIVFAPGGELNLGLSNPYLLAALVSVALMWKTGNVLLTTVLSMGVFLVLNLLV